MVPQNHPGTTSGREVWRLVMAVMESNTAIEFNNETYVCSIWPYDLRWMCVNSAQFTHSVRAPLLEAGKVQWKCPVYIGPLSTWNYETPSISTWKTWVPKFQLVVLINVLLGGLTAGAVLFPSALPMSALPMSSKNWTQRRCKKKEIPAEGN
jgi:hypothetical protein